MLSLKKGGQQAMSQFIERFTLRKDTTKGKPCYDATEKQAVNLFKEGITKKKRFIPEDEDQSIVDILSTFDKKSTLIFIKLWNSHLQASRGPSAKNNITAGQIRNPFSETIWTCYHQFLLQRLYPKVSTSRL